MKRQRDDTTRSDDDSAAGAAPPGDGPRLRVTFGPSREQRPSEPRRVLDASRHGVSALLVHPDGRRLISGGAYGDGRVRVWDLERGECRLTIRTRHEGEIRTLALDAGGRLLTTSENDDPRAITWDLATGKRVQTIDNRDSASVFAFPLAEGRVLTADGRLRLWQGRKARWSVDPPRGGPLDLGLYLGGPAPDGRTFLALRVGEEQRGAIERYRLEDGAFAGRVELAHRFTDALELVGTLLVHPDGRRLVWAPMGVEPAIWIWDSESGAVLGKLEGHEAEVLDVHLVDGGRRLISAGGDRTLRLWDLDERRCLGACPVYGSAPRVVRTSLDGQLLVAGCHDGTIRFWPVAGAFVEPQSLPLLQRANDAITIPGTEDAVVAFHDGALRRFFGGRRLGPIWRDRLDEVRVKAAALAGAPDLLGRCLAVSRDGRRLVVAQSDIRVRPPSPKSKDWKPDRERRAVLHVFDVESGRREHLVPGPDETLMHFYLDGAAFTPDGERVVFTHTPPVVLSVLDLRTGQVQQLRDERHDLDRYPMAPRHVSPEAALCVGPGVVQRFRLDPPALETEWRFQPEMDDDRAGFAVWGEGGDQRAATTTSDRALRVRVAATGEPVLEVEPTPKDADRPWTDADYAKGWYAYPAVVAAPGAGLLATAEDDPHVRLRDMATGKVLHLLRGGQGFVAGMAFAPDEARLLVITTDGTARVHELRPPWAAASWHGGGPIVRAKWLGPTRLVVVDKAGELWGLESVG